MLNLASRLYALGAGVRRASALRHPERARRLDRPVISVGNLAVGGTGKTPLVSWLAAALVDSGERPAILSRGYARTRAEPGVTVVSDGVRIRADLERAGDEPLMLARALPRVRVLVSPDRYLAGRVAERHLGATVHLLDDGFQHFALARDVNLLVVDPADLDPPVTLPSGRLRESPGAARAADALVVAGDEAARVEVASRLGVLDSYRLVRDLGPPMEEGYDGPHPVPASTRVVIVSGIARPERFEEETRAAGFEVTGAVRFTDHHPFGAPDLARIAERVRTTGAAFVLTTEKDLMRLLPLRPWPFRVAVRPLRVHVEPDLFIAWVRERLAAARAGRDAGGAAA